MKETIVKMSVTESWFFEKRELTNLQPDLSRKEEKNQVNKIRNGRGAVTIDNGKMQRALRDCHEQLKGNKMGRFLGKFNLPRLNQEETEIMNNPITSSETTAVIKNLPPKKQKPRSRWLHRRILSNI